jgi:hypothetical protein
VLYPQDIQEVLELRLSARATEYHVAWLYEKSGIFSVRSAYHLVVSMDKANENQEGGNARVDGSRLGFKRIWSANVPPKVKVFAWRLCQEGLSTQSNRMNRGLEHVVTYQVCGKEDKMGYHAVVHCPQATALRYEPWKGWIPPDKGQFSWKKACDTLVLL